ncbi:MAG TPA: cell division protein FtsK [Alphaproteobacteria bacterium]|nr:cell division protein FtsK [Alphaproteobacteria bacterium]
MGLMLFVLGVIGVFALISYNPYDQSWDFSTETIVKNWGGVIGANISSAYLAFVGLSGYFVSICFLIWGVKIVRYTFITPDADTPWYKNGYARFTFFILSLVSLSGLLSCLDNAVKVPDEWVTSSYGGHVGMLVKSLLQDVIGYQFFLVIFLFLFIATALMAIGLSVDTWLKIIAITAICIGTFGSYIRRNIKRFSMLLFSFAKRLWVKKTTEITERQEETEKQVTRARKIVETAGRKKAEKEVPKQETLDMEMSGNFQLPPLALLKNIPDDQVASKPSQSSLSANAELLERVLNDFGVQGKIIEVQPGPVVTLYSLEPSPGLKSSRVIGLSDDIARSMLAISARISVIAGQNAIGIELPNAARESVYLKEMIISNDFKKSKMSLPIILGKNIAGNPIVIDLAKTPHLLVAGTTGSGKSVGLNCMILSLLYKFAPHECKFIMIDPKMLELSVYQDIPHLLSPVVTEPHKAIVALKWAVKEMENRYRLMAQLNVRNIDGYNEKILAAKKIGKTLTRTIQTGYDADTGRPTMEEVPLEMEKLPYIVVIVDEMADLMIVAGKEIEASVQRLAQMARAAGIHVILATQRPSVDVITGIIKANFPSRISFQVTSKIDSRTILGEQGAEQLLGRGDMLYMAAGTKITRVHGPFVSDNEVEEIANYLRKQAKPNYVDDVTTSDEEFGDMGSSSSKSSSGDKMYDEAVSIVIRDQKVSTSYIQRVLKIGYNKAANIIEQMEKDGIISAPDHVGRRQILMK